MQTFKYKDGYIHVNFMNPKEDIVTFTYKNFGCQVKSIQSAKLKITKLMKIKF